MPTVNIPFIGDEYQAFIVSANRTGTAHIVNNGTDHIYVFDPAINSDHKILAGGSGDIPVVKGSDYTVKVCGTVSVTWSIT